MKVIALHQDQQQIIEQAVANNRHAQQKIYAQYSAKMLGVCRQYAKDLHHAEDLMITAFMKVFANLSKFEGKGSFEGWIRRIMVNECISWLRVQKQLRFTDDGYYAEEGFNDIESGLGVEEIQGLIDALPDGYRMIFNLYAIEGYKHREIAEMLGISEGTSKSQLSHARRMLQQQLSRRNDYETPLTGF